MKPFKKKTPVQWKWAGGKVSGVVEEIFLESITKTIKGSKITRHGSPEKPAYLVRSEAGNIALKLQTELIEIPKVSKRAKASKPKFDVSKLKA